MSVNVDISFESGNGYLTVDVEHLVIRPLIVANGSHGDTPDTHPDSSTGVDCYAAMIERQFTRIELHDGLRVNLSLGACELESRNSTLLCLDHIIRKNSDRRRCGALVDEDTRTGAVQDCSAGVLRRIVKEGARRS